WEGFDDTAETWKPIENLAGYEQDITAFRKREEVRLAELAAKEARNKRKAPEENRSGDNAEEDEESGVWVEGLGGRRKAECWRYLKVRLDPENDDKILEIMCKTCGVAGSVAYSGNTSNLRSHLSHAMLPPVSEDRRDELHKKVRASRYSA
ncbi:hypothetical protein CYMTET_34403, partial [Cymbomonas tetramitiformis]